MAKKRKQEKLVRNIWIGILVAAGVTVLGFEAGSRTMGFLFASLIFAGTISYVLNISRAFKKSQTGWILAMLFLAPLGYLIYMLRESKQLFPTL